MYAHTHVYLHVCVCMFVCVCVCVHACIHIHMHCISPGKGSNAFDITQVVTLREIPFVEVTEMPADGVCKPMKEGSHSFPCHNYTTGKSGSATQGCAATA